MAENEPIEVHTLAVYQPADTQPGQPPSVLLGKGVAVIDGMPMRVIYGGSYRELEALAVFIANHPDDEAVAFVEPWQIIAKVGMLWG